MTDSSLQALSRTLGALLAQRSLKLATAESCTGGWVAMEVTAVAGSSGWFDRGFVTYSNEAKRELLGVEERTLSLHGAVSEPVAREMAEGALRRSRAGIAVAITGIAGPGGGTPAKPVGTVCIGWAGPSAASFPVEVKTFLFDGDRDSVRRQSVAAALAGLIERVKGCA
jgi:nicotinamide-nucleotide amidase